MGIATTRNYSVTPERCQPDLKARFMKNADRMVRLLNNILDYERIELGTFEMQFREVNLKDVFQEVIAGFTPIAEEKQVSIRMKAMNVTAPVDADRVQQAAFSR